jgi:oligoribonuclease NrnB/cAMP/cGMP phosphodiesterase (DHH superfamily)
MTRLRDITGNVIWIDHHKTAKSYPYQDLPGLKAFDGSYSGCELTWLYFFPELNNRMPRAVQLIGDYDKWALQYQPECFEFYEGMKMQENNPLAAVWRYLFSHDLFTLGLVIVEGKTAIRYRDTYCKDVCDSYGYETKIDAVCDLHPTYRAWCTNIYRFGSQGFGQRFEDYDLCVAYIHDGRKFTVSLYSTTVDVSAIAKFFGGGGHTGAAGFVCEKLPWERA